MLLRVDRVLAARLLVAVGVCVIGDAISRVERVAAVTADRDVRFEGVRLMEEVETDDAVLEPVLLALFEVSVVV